MAGFVSFHGISNRPEVPAIFELFTALATFQEGLVTLREFLDQTINEKLFDPTYLWAAVLIPANTIANTIVEIVKKEKWVKETAHVRFNKLRIYVRYIVLAAMLRSLTAWESHVPDQEFEEFHTDVLWETEKLQKEHDKEYIDLHGMFLLYLPSQFEKWRLRYSQAPTPVIAFRSRKPPKSGPLYVSGTPPISQSFDTRATLGNAWKTLLAETTDTNYFSTNHQLPHLPDPFDIEEIAENFYAAQLQIIPDGIENDKKERKHNKPTPKKNKKNTTSRNSDRNSDGDEEDLKPPAAAAVTDRNIPIDLRMAVCSSFIRFSEEPYISQPDTIRDVICSLNHVQERIYTMLPHTVNQAEKAVPIDEKMFTDLSRTITLAQTHGDSEIIQKYPYLAKQPKTETLEAAL